MGRTAGEITPIEHICWLEKRVANLEQQLDRSEKRYMTALALVPAASDGYSDTLQENAVADYIKDLEQQLKVANEWISVDERLPEDQQPIVAGCWGRGSSMMTTYFTNGGFPVYPTGRVTHWMPIPPLPAIKGEG